MKNEIFIEYDNVVIKFPVNPEEISLSRDGNNETTEILSIGEINVIKEPKLATLEFSCFFPATKEPAYVLTKGDFKKPDFYIKFLEKIRKDKAPCRFIVSNTTINIMCSIESFEYGIQAGPVGEIYYSISLKEHREYVAKEVKIVNSNKSKNKKNSNSSSAKKKKTTKKRSSKPSKKTPYTGCKVRINGRLHRDSYGKGPGQWRRNYVGKINFIKKRRKYLYHVTTPTGGWLGWVVASAVEVIK